MVRMEQSLDKFFNEGGTTKFVDRLTSSLGIDPSTVKIVSVYEGSLVVNYNLEVKEPESTGDAAADAKAAEEAKKKLDELKNK